MFYTILLVSFGLDHGGGFEANPRNTGHEVGIYTGWDASPSQVNLHIHSHLGNLYKHVFVR